MSAGPRGPLQWRTACLEREHDGTNRGGGGKKFSRKSTRNFRVDTKTKFKFPYEMRFRVVFVFSCRHEEEWGKIQGVRAQISCHREPALLRLPRSFSGCREARRARHVIEPISEILIHRPRSVVPFLSILQSYQEDFCKFQDSRWLSKAGERVLHARHSVLREGACLGVVPSSRNHVDILRCGMKDLVCTMHQTPSWSPRID